MLHDPWMPGGMASLDLEAEDAEERRREAELRRQLDEALERALVDTFPASDPPGVTQPPHSRLDKDKP